MPSQASALLLGVFWRYAKDHLGYRVLTELRCRQAKAAEKIYKLSDARGLHMFVTSTRFRSWRWKYRIARKEKLLVLGSYPEVGLALAREHRDTAARLLKAGTDPRVDRKQTAAVRKAEHATTFEAVAREWHAQQVTSWVAVHAADVLNSLEKDVFPYIGSTPIAAVTSPMVLQLVRRIEERPSVETARRVRQHISAVYGFAIASGYATSDPAIAIRGAMRPLVKKRQPALASLEEARALLTAAEASAAHPITKLASRLLALTALRPGVTGTSSLYGATPPRLSKRYTGGKAQCIGAREPSGRGDAGAMPVTVISSPPRNASPSACHRRWRPRSTQTRHRASRHGFPLGLRPGCHVRAPA